MKFIAIVNRSMQIASDKFDLWQEAFEVSESDSVKGLCERIKDRIGYAGEVKIIPVIGTDGKV